MRSNSASTFSRFLSGALTPIQAVGLIVPSTRLLTLSALPILVTCAVLAVAFYALMTGVWTLASTTFTGFFADYQTGLGWLMMVVAGFAFLFLSIHSLSLLTGLFASPLNDFLAEATEKQLGVKNIPGFGIGRLIRVFFLDLRKSVFTLAASLVFGLLLLLPGIGLIGLPGLALTYTLSFVTYPQSRREHGLIHSIRWVTGERLPESLGFGLMLTALFSIPVINLFALPVAVVAGTMLFVQCSKE